MIATKQGAVLKPPPILTDTERLFAHLHRGGNVAHLWTDAGNRSYWFHVAEDAAEDAPAGGRTVPRGWLAHNVYFTVHPLTQVPPANSAGNADPRYIGSQLPYIAAVNALFAEYDGKETVAPAEYTPYLPQDYAALKQVEQRQAVAAAQARIFYTDPDLYKRRAHAAIARLEYPPSVVVDSGGGYHCYWLLTAPLHLDAANRADVQAVQHAWVRLVGGDPGASDLRRLLRVPGTHNLKPGFRTAPGAAPRLVRFVKADFGLLYDYRELEEAANDWLAGQAAPRRQMALLAPQPSKSKVPNPKSLRAAFDRTHSLVDLLTTHGYTVAYATPAITRLRRPGGRLGASSVTVFPAHDDVPERSVHFSTHDPLYSEEYVDAETRQVRRRTHDAFAAYVYLEHDGDWRAAYAAGRDEMIRLAQSGDFVKQEQRAPAASRPKKPAKLVDSKRRPIKQEVAPPQPRGWRLWHALINQLGWR